MKSDIIYIGLHGFAGSGKDTVAKMLLLLLNNSYDEFEEFKNDWENTLMNSPQKLATFNTDAKINDKSCICIAFADQLKYVCSSMFGIPVERFYYNKANSWVCINKDFKYTEVHPDPNHIITAEEYYYGHSKYQNTSDKYYMSLREVLVYVGTYICQEFINKDIFINIVNNEIERMCSRNRNLKYAVLTDVRFIREMEFVHKNNGIMIDIVRDDVTQLENAAEHDMDDVSEYDITIDNSGTYDDLLHYMWDIVHENEEFKNITYHLYTRDDYNCNYLRYIGKSENGEDMYKLCTSHHTQRVNHSNGVISMIDPMGGPTIYVGAYIDGTNIIPKRIEMSPINSKFIIYA